MPCPICGENHVKFILSKEEDMIRVTCDYCGKGCSHDPQVQLKGVSGASGILLPEPFMEKDFCSPKCFWEWALKQFVDFGTVKEVWKEGGGFHGYEIWRSL
jgi:hypothetical protein